MWYKKGNDFAEEKVKIIKVKHRNSFVVWVVLFNNRHADYPTEQIIPEKNEEEKKKTVACATVE